MGSVDGVLIALVVIGAMIVAACVTFDRMARRRGRGDGDLDVLNAARDGADASLAHGQLAAQMAKGADGSGAIGLGGLG